MLMLFYILVHQQAFLMYFDLVYNMFGLLFLNNFVGKTDLIHIKDDGS